MMMNSLLQQRRDRKNKKTLTPAGTGILVAVVSLALVHFFFPHTVSGFLHTIARPLWSAQQATVVLIEGVPQYLQSKQKLITENSTLQSQIKVMQLQLHSRNVLYEENKTLKELLGRGTAEDTLLAGILSRPHSSLYDTFVIDIGRTDGVEEGASVVVSGDIVIGVVERVFKNTSLVTLFSTPGVETEIVIGLQQIVATAIGRGGGNFVAQLPRDVGIEEGDSIVIPGVGIKLFGIVETIEVDITQPFQTILFKNPVNIAEIKWVQVVKK